MGKLSIIEALCVIQSGISNDEERKLYDVAFDVVVEESKRLKLNYKKELIELEQSKEMEEQQQGYSEEELKSAFKIGFNIGYGSTVQELDLKNEHCEKWFEQFKKK
jgi:hypothetical protein